MPVPFLTIRNARDSARHDRIKMGRQVTWVPGTVQPHSSMWITVQRLLVLNRPSSEDFLRTFVRSNCRGVSRLSLDPIPPILGRRTRDPISLLRVSRVLREPPACFAGSQAFQYPAGVRAIFGTYLAWCPQCLDEGFHSVLYSLFELRECPIHGLGLERALPCGHRVEHGDLGSSLRHPGHCGKCGAVFLSERAARKVDRNPGRDLRLNQLSNWLHEVGSRCWFRIPGLITPTGEVFLEQIANWVQTLRLSPPPDWWYSRPIPPDFVQCPWRCEVHRYGGAPPSTQLVALPKTVDANDAIFKSIRRYVVHHVLANRRHWLTKLAASGDADQIAGWLRQEPRATEAMTVLLWYQACLGLVSLRDWLRRPSSRRAALEPRDEEQGAEHVALNDIDARAFAWVADRLRVTAALAVWASAHEAVRRTSYLSEPLWGRGVAARRLAPVWSTGKLPSGDWSLCVDAPPERCLRPPPTAVDRSALN